MVALGRYGGFPVYSLELARSLGARCELLPLVSRYAENIERWRAMGLPVVEVETFPSGWRGVWRALYPGHCRSVAARIKAFGPQVVYYPVFHVWNPLVNRLVPGVPKVTTVHDARLHRGERNPLHDWLQFLSIRQSRRVIVLSQASREVLQARGVPGDRIDVIPHGEFSYYFKLGTAGTEEQGDRPPTLLFFGRISPYKGLGVLLRAFPLVRQEVPEARLLVAGRGDLRPYRELLEGLRGVEVINRWLAEEEVARLFGRSQVLVAPYLEGSQSGVIPLACAAGIPAVATRVGGIPEQVEHGRTGLLVEPGNPRELAAACAALLADPARAREMGGRARARALTEWSWDRIAGLVLESCRQALGGETPASRWR